MPMVINEREVGTQTHTHIPTHEPKQFHSGMRGRKLHAPGLKRDLICMVVDI